MNRRPRSIFAPAPPCRVRRNIPNRNHEPVNRSLRRHTLRPEPQQVQERTVALPHTDVVTLMAGWIPCRVHNPSSTTQVTLATHNKQMVRKKIIKAATMVLNLPNFQGTETPAEAEMWIREFEKIQHLHNWYDKMAMTIVRARLVGRAADWFTTKRMELLKFSRFCAWFKYKYVEEGTEYGINWDSMTARVQQPEEPAYNYACDKVTLCDGIGVNFEYAKKQILLGLRSKSLARALQKSSHKSSEELLKDVVKHEEVSSRRYQQAAVRYLINIGKLAS